MRPGQNKRMRGRNPGRKGPNPLTRSYESNGPDVKIRGTAQHVAEKYLQLARDAQSSGDPVMAESYLQHAEHYFRIIAAAHQAQQQAQMGHMRPPGEQVEEENEEDDDPGLGLSDRFASVAERLPPQPVYNAQNFQPQPNFSGGQPQPYGERPRYNDRQDRQNFGDRQGYNGGDRNERWRDRQPHDRQDRQQDRPTDGPIRIAGIAVATAAITRASSRIRIAATSAASAATGRSAAAREGPRAAPRAIASRPNCRPSSPRLAPARR